MKNITARLIFAIAIGGLVNSAQAEDGFHPNDNCFETLDGASKATQVMLTSWIFGYQAGQSKIAQVDFSGLEEALNTISDICANNQSLSIALAVNILAAPSAEIGGSQAHARSFLMQFYDPAVDNNALTQSLLPTEAEVRTIYKEPLASPIIQRNIERFGPSVTFNPGAGHDDLLVVRATTDDLIAGDAILNQFPGGYKDVLPYLNPGFPIVRFKFITTGETLGLAFDGLIYINDHWVIIPKPWRLVPEN